MQVSRPHWVEVEQSLGCAGVGRQLPARQNSPVWQSAFSVQLGEHTPLTHAPSLQSEAFVHVANVEQEPDLQPHVEWQSEVREHVEPAQPN